MVYCPVEFPCQQDSQPHNLRSKFHVMVLPHFRVWLYRHPHAHPPTHPRPPTHPPACVPLSFAHPPTTTDRTPGMLSAAFYVCSAGPPSVPPSVRCCHPIICVPLFMVAPICCPAPLRCALARSVPSRQCCTIRPPLPFSAVLLTDQLSFFNSMICACDVHVASMRRCVCSQCYHTVNFCKRNPRRVDLSQNRSV